MTTIIIINSDSLNLCICRYTRSYTRKGLSLLLHSTIETILHSTTVPLNVKALSLCMLTTIAGAVIGVPSLPMHTVLFAF